MADKRQPDITAHNAMEDAYQKTDKVKHFEDIVSEKTQGDYRPWHLQYYVPYFDVTSNQVFHRVKKSLLPNNDSFFEHDSPDLYAPFWLSATLVFMIVAAGHFTMYLEGDESWSFNLEKVSTATMMVFGLWAGVPLALYCLLNHLGQEPVALELVSLYGYSYTALILGCVLCIVPYMLFRMIAMGVSTAWSAFLFTKNTKDELQSAPWWGYCVSLGGHAVIYLLCVFHFFSA